MGELRITRYVIRLRGERYTVTPLGRHSWCLRLFRTRRCFGYKGIPLRSFRHPRNPLVTLSFPSRRNHLSYHTPIVTYSPQIKNGEDLIRHIFAALPPPIEEHRVTPSPKNTGLTQNVSTSFSHSQIPLSSPYRRQSPPHHQSLYYYIYLVVVVVGLCIRWKTCFRP